jgi:hypothetical protein
MRTHKHHIIPRSRGGSDHPSNLIELSEYDHAYKHALDFILFEHSPRFDFRQSGWRLLPPDLQEAVRTEHSRRMSNLRSGSVLSEAHKQKLSDANKGKPKPPRSEEHRRNMSIAKTGKQRGPLAEEHKARIGAANKGKIRSKEARDRMSRARKQYLAKKQ